MSMITGVHFHPTEVELTKFLTMFLRGESFPSQYPIQLAEVYGDQSPWQIFGASNLEEKVGYFISPLKKRSESDERYCRNCANGTWKGQTSGKPIKNRKGSVVGFRRNYIYQSPAGSRSSKQEINTTNWLMREYFVGDDFFTNNNIPKQDFALCRIKKYIKEKKEKKKKEKDVARVCDNTEEHEVEGIIQHMLHAPNHAQVMAEEIGDEWDSIINRVCDEQVDHEVENSNSLIHRECDLRALEEEAYAQIEQVQGHGADDIGSNHLWEEMNGIFEDINVDISDCFVHLDDQSPIFPLDY